jgi:hypothetical protein
MKNNYYNNWELKKIFNCCNKDPYLAIREAEEYMAKYPEDYAIYAYYASFLITLGRFKEAEAVINKVELLVQNDYKYQNLKDKMTLLKNNINYAKLRIYTYTERYQEFLKLYYEEPGDLKLGAEKLYCRKKLGFINQSDRDTYTYLYRQIISYDENDFLKHIRKHLADYNNIDEPNTNVFVPGFPIDKIIQETKKYIPGDKKIYSGFIENSYYFKYDNCGKEKNKYVDYFKIAAFKETSDYITICPVADGESLPYIDLNYLRVPDKPMVRKLSPIDKFNRKYGIK